MTYKTCTKCGRIFEATTEFFYRCKTLKSGLTSQCKTCCKQAVKESMAKKPEMYREMNKAAVERWKERYPEKQPKANANRRHWDKSPKYRLTASMRGHIRRSILKWRKCLSEGPLFDDTWETALRWKFLTGYSLMDLMYQLEELFRPGMTWANYGEWEIDHRIPVVVFPFSSVSDEAFRDCWAMSNLRPLWKDDNLSYSRGITKNSNPEYVHRLINKRERGSRLYAERLFLSHSDQIEDRDQD